MILTAVDCDVEEDNRARHGCWMIKLVDGLINSCLSQSSFICGSACGEWDGFGLRKIRD